MLETLPRTKERPILMSASMVQAFLAGNKTQTRRAFAKKHAFCLEGIKAFYEDGGGNWIGCSSDGPNEAAFVKKAYPNGEGIKCPYGQPGDRLWVRETWSTYPIHLANPKTKGKFWMPFGDKAAYYRASCPDLVNGADKWKPSIFMPREVSRIVLEVVSVRVERLQEISESDAIAEGLTKLTKDGTLFKYGIPDRDGLPGTDNTGWEWQYWCESPIDAYWALWESINGKGSWDENPWVWVVEFKKCQ
jgi:hypothetical protein